MTRSESPEPADLLAQPATVATQVVAEGLTMYVPAGDGPPEAILSPDMMIVMRAVERGGDLSSVMETMYKLRVAERKHNARLAFNAALARFQESCPPVPRTSKAEIKTRTGTTFNYAFADFQQIVETIHPHLRANGLSFTFDSAVDGDHLTCVCFLRHTEGHAATSRFTLPTTTASAMSAQQAVGAALTFAKRQALTSVLGLALTDPDPDAAADPTTITEEEAANLSALADEVGANHAKVLAWVGVARWGDIRATDKARVVAQLERKRKGGGA